MRAEPIVNGLEDEWGDAVSVVQIDIHNAENQGLLSTLDVQFTPTFILFDRNRQEVWRSVDAVDSDEARQQVSKIEQTS